MYLQGLCPYCQSDNGQFIHEYQSGNMIEIEIICPDCHKSFFEYYRIEFWATRKKRDKKLIKD